MTAFEQARVNSEECRIVLPPLSFLAIAIAIMSQAHEKIKSEIGNIERFPDGEKLCSYAGLVPSVSISGKYRRHGSITKEGSRWLRWIMVESVHTHLKYDTSITRAYHAIAERKGAPVAKVAAARRLLMCCYSVLRNREPYHDPAGHYQPS